MTNGHPELSSAGILGISLVIAAAGCAAYLLVMPVSPAKLVAWEHAAVNEPMTR